MPQDPEVMHENSGALALRSTTTAVQTVEEFSVAEVSDRVKKVRELYKDVMKPNIHYGVIPNTDKPTILQPGVDLLSMMFRLDAQFSHEIIREGEHREVISHCTIFHIPTGVRVSSAEATCSTRESKYAWRQASRKCPNCGKEAIIKGKAEYGGGWLCFAKKGGCGHKWADGAKEIEGQTVGRVPNPDLPDTYNTVLKIAHKRSKATAILNATAGTEVFTVDLDDFDQGDDPGETFHGSEDRKGEGAGSPEPAKRTRQTKPKPETAPESTGTQAATGAEPEATLLQQIETAFAAIEYPDDAKREEGRVLFLKMFSLPKEGTWADLWKGRKPEVVAKQADALVKIMNGKAEGQRKTKEAQNAPNT